MAKATTITKNQKRAYLILVAVVGVLLLWMLRFYAWPFLISIIIYLVLDKPYLTLLKKMGNRASLASAAMVMAVLIVLFVPLSLLLGAIANEAISLSQNLNNQITVEQVQNYIQEQDSIKAGLESLNIDVTTVNEQVVEWVKNSSASIFDSIKNTILSSAQAVANFFFMLIFLYFLFRDGEMLKKKLLQALPFPDELETRIFERMSKVTKDVFYGNIVITILQGAAVGIALAVVGVPHPILLGFAAGVLSLIPIVGTFLIWIPAALFLLLQGSVVAALGLVVWCLIAGIGLDNIVKPKLLDRKLNLHPLLIFFALLGGLQAFGFIGILLGPLVAVLFIALWEIVRDWDNIKKDLNITEAS